jgi:hypothetical protein
MLTGRRVLRPDLQHFPFRALAAVAVAAVAPVEMEAPPGRMAVAVVGLLKARELQRSGELARLEL